MNEVLHMTASIMPSLTVSEMLGLPITRAMMACAVAFLLTLLAGPRVIRALISLKLGQPIRSQEEVHKLAELHGAKAGTPTMGGVLIVASTLIATLVFAKWNILVLVCLFAMLSLALLGFADDYSKVKKKTSAGISARMKLVGQTLVGLICICVLYYMPESTRGVWWHIPELVSQVYVPFYGTIDIGWFCIPFCTLTLVATSNAVNLTDGLDGLASGCTVTNGLAFALIALIAANPLLSIDVIQIPHHPMYGELSVFLMALVGAALGFLWYNCYPARVFMGDTGSLAIGGALGMAAICLSQELLLIVIGGVFVMEGTSVVLQVLSFQTTGKRIFRMAPIHHHFELGGWKETQVIVRFWMISLILALIGLLSLITAR